MKTADLFDQFGDTLQSCEIQFRQFGGLRSFAGPVRTLRTLEDNALLREILGTPGDGAVLIVDGGGSLRAALLGDQLAKLAHANRWVGIVIHGAVRDTEALATVPIGIKALGTNPRKSTKSRIGESGTTITIGGASFSPGSWMCSDNDGIVVSSTPLSSCHFL